MCSGTVCFQSDGKGWKYVSKRLVKGDKTGKKFSKQIWEITQDIQNDDDDDNDDDDNEFESYCVHVDKDWRGTEYRRSIRNSSGGSRSKGRASGSRGRWGRMMERSRWIMIRR
jgi:hypothetical protein